MNIYLNLPTQCECSSGVEHHLAKVRVVGPNPITRSKVPLFFEGFFTTCPDGGIGRHVGLKIQWTVMSVRVQVPLWVPKKVEGFFNLFLYEKITCIIKKNNYCALKEDSV